MRMEAMREAVEAYGGVIISVCILLAVEFAARRGSPWLAAAASSIPTGIPLALFLVASKAGNQQALVAFSDACVRGGLGTLAFTIAMAITARKAGCIWMLAAGYTAWFVIWWATSPQGSMGSNPGSRDE
mmetsp:Transcript_24660/g.48042  ORF Transcript_24660/g.48042 Transcript_24660/m.48042 type:complete len:129 (+) Transcript_24660:61-447(+)|eukprot:CAMPEP_0172871372 /NCGR_PEP_ID=MMETSP1075-20121228/92047_1 /TAXON_ID=2916 /ORGANISM="Ceratium fusus, Strain PA161109" /LENGTH=128 /DNA_ID=CAMNT_0013721601 /DNA_START=53 /DNA_END=439 /DNA_ORIENTATION=+